MPQSVESIHLLLTCFPFLRKSRRGRIVTLCFSLARIRAKVSSSICFSEAKASLTVFGVFDDFVICLIQLVSFIPMTSSYIPMTRRLYTDLNVQSDLLQNLVFGNQSGKIILLFIYLSPQYITTTV